LDETRDQTPLTDAFTGALAWVDAATLTPILPGLLSAAVPATLRRTGVIGCAAQRRDPGDALAGALADQDAALRAAGLWAAGVLGRRDLRGAMTHHLQDDDEACRFWSAWSTVRLGEDAALPALWSFVEGGGERAEAACQLAVMRMSAGEASVKLDALDGDEGARVAVIGAGAFGDIARVPWLIERMAEPQLARIAGEAFTILTGAPIAGTLIAAPPADHVAGPTEHPDDDDVALDPDEHRRWPNADAVAAWWQQHASDYVAGVRHFLGQPVADQVLHAALRLAPQTVRALAALKLAAQSPGQPLFPVDAPGFRQLAALR
jgi:uncharacterized protein (TIGR02270 family)